ncbi:MAG TPA: hemerythrin domain-containing protein [Thiolapillus brandeum]|uniref:Hemerythrin domain-containing protein n=1 Tax=Thiolapillus brandeum TaxID=1076588 RepID=A0A831RW30_9GAMM|nr:hemerythrin domain-containing protein [Thiolapillus brandeum]
MHPSRGMLRRNWCSCTVQSPFSLIICSIIFHRARGAGLQETSFGRFQKGGKYSMFGFFRRKKQLAGGQRKGRAPGTEIYYHSELVPELLDDHKQLLKLFTEIGQEYAAERFTQLPLLLRDFGTLLREHLLKENVKLYIYLKHTLADDPESAALTQGFRSEMHGINRTVTRFLSHYILDEWDEQRRKQFGADLDAIGKVLVKRIETEESVLYPLYQPPKSKA